MRSNLYGLELLSFTFMFSFLYFFCVFVDFHFFEVVVFYLCFYSCLRSFVSCFVFYFHFYSSFSLHLTVILFTSVPLYLFILFHLFLSKSLYSLLSNYYIVNISLFSSLLFLLPRDEGLTWSREVVSCLAKNEK